MRIVLTRHGETDWNIAGRLQGHSQTPINERGRLEAHTVGDALLRVGVTKVFSSDLLRAIQTAEIISEQLGLSFEKDMRLREYCFGSLEGEASQEILSRNYAAADAYTAWDFTSFGGESQKQVHARMNEFLNELEEKYFSETVLLVSHGAFVYGLQKHFGLLIQEEDGSVRGIKRGEFQVIDFQNNKARQVDFWSVQNNVKKT